MAHEEGMARHTRAVTEFEEHEKRHDGTRVVLSLTAGLLAVFLAQLGQLFLERREPLEDLVFGRLRSDNRNTAPIEQGLDEGIGISDDGMCQPTIERPIEPENTGDGLTLR